MSIASDNSLVAFEDFADGLASVFAAQAVNQVLLQQIVSEPDHSIDGIPSIIPSQQVARQNAAYWMESLQPALATAFSRVKQFANLYASLGDADIEECLSNLDTPDGKVEFKELMFTFHDEASQRAQELGSTSSQLTDFATALSTDLTNLRGIRDEVRASRDTTEIEKVRSQLNSLAEQMTETTKLAGQFPPPLGLTITLGAVAAGSTPVIEAGLRASASGPQAVLLQQAAEAAAQHRDTFTLLAELDSPLAVLEWVVGTYDQFIGANEDAARALTGLINAWQTTSTHFSDLADLAAGTVDAETIALIRTHLTQARDTVTNLKAEIETYEQAITLTVTPGAEESRLLRLPTSWVDRPIDGGVFESFVTSNRRR